MSKLTNDEMNELRNGVGMGSVEQQPEGMTEAIDMINDSLLNNKIEPDLGYDIKYVYDNDGNIALKRETLDGKSHGKTTTYKDGILVRDTLFENDVPEGEINWYYPNGNVEITGNNVNGVLHGYVTFYEPDGVTVSQTDIYINGVNEGELTEPYTAAKQLENDGEFRIKEYHDNFVLKSTFLLVDGKVEGVVEYYDRDGSLIKTTEFINDKRNGESITYQRNGEVIMRANYLDNCLLKK